MQPTLIDIEHRRAVWGERQRREWPDAVERQPRGPRRLAAALLARAAACLDREAARMALAMSPAAGRRP
jgi:hypothetical protein